MWKSEKLSQFITVIVLWVSALLALTLDDGRFDMILVSLTGLYFYLYGRFSHASGWKL